ncbi:hypothetical protein GM182_03510 [bacterium 3DAC]|nr:hypothetical protein GM182_03510 [bacterium 3DAC]
MSWYLYLYVFITLLIIGGSAWFIIWLKKKIAPWNSNTGGFIIVDRFVIDFKWHIVVLKYRDKYYMVAFSDKDFRLLDIWEEEKHTSSGEVSFKEVLGE